MNLFVITFSVFVWVGAFSMNKKDDVVTKLKAYDELLRSNFVGLLSTIRYADGLISTNPAHSRTSPRPLLSIGF